MPLVPDELPGLDEPDEADDDLELLPASVLLLPLIDERDEPPEALLEPCPGASPLMPLRKSEPLADPSPLPE